MKTACPCCWLGLVTCQTPVAVQGIKGRRHACVTSPRVHTGRVRRYFFWKEIGQKLCRLTFHCATPRCSFVKLCWCCPAVRDSGTLWHTHRVWLIFSWQNGAPWIAQMRSGHKGQSEPLQGPECSYWHMQMDLIREWGPALGRHVLAATPALQ